MHMRVYIYKKKNNSCHINVIQSARYRIPIVVLFAFKTLKVRDKFKFLHIPNPNCWLPSSLPANTFKNLGIKQDRMLTYIYTFDHFYWIFRVTGSFPYRKLFTFYFQFTSVYKIIGYFRDRTIFPLIEYEKNQYSF
jgi:hypothetical protein